MHAALTVRKLKAGSFAAWRKAWEPEEWPEEFKEAYILRSTSDPDEIIAFGFIEGTQEELDKLRAGMRDEEQKRQDRMAPHIESIGTDGFYEVVEVVKPTVAARR